jgi:hypothetical protein
MGDSVFGTGVTGTSATRTDLAADYGAVRWYKGNKYRLFKAGAAIPVTLVCKFSAIDGTSAGAEGTIGETVIKSGAITDMARCVNDTGAEITSGNYFWGLVEGYVVLTGDGNVTAGSTIMPNANGLVINFTEATSGLGNNACGIALENDAPAVTCFFKAGFNRDTNA